MIRGGTGENARLREQRKAQEAQNDAELLAYTNELLAKEWEDVRAGMAGPKDVGGGGVERIPSSPGAAASSAHRPDETDDQWATKWEDDFDRSREEWERFS